MRLQRLRFILENAIQQDRMAVCMEQLFLGSFSAAREVVSKGKKKNIVGERRDELGKITRWMDFDVCELWKVEGRRIPSGRS